MSDKNITVSFTYDDNDRINEILALKSLVFSILRNLPHDIAINTIKSIKNDRNDPAVKKFCSEITSAMIATSEATHEN